MQNAAFRRITIIILSIVFLGAGLTACDLSSPPTTPDQQQQGQQYSNDAYSRLTQAEPPVQMTDSLARKEINKRYQVFNNATTYGYFYGFVQGVAQPVIEYVVQGAVFPVDDAITPPQTINACSNGGDQGAGACAVVVPAAQPDGTFNTNGSAMFGFEADGTYFEWDGPYAYATHPLGFRPLSVEGCVKGAQC